MGSHRYSTSPPVAVVVSIRGGHVTSARSGLARREIGIDGRILAAAGIPPGEWVRVLDLERGLHLADHRARALPTGTAAIEVHAAAQEGPLVGSELLVLAHRSKTFHEQDTRTVWLDAENRIIGVWLTSARPTDRPRTAGVRAPRRRQRRSRPARR